MLLKVASPVLCCADTGHGRGGISEGWEKKGGVGDGCSKGCLTDVRLTGMFLAKSGIPVTGSILGVAIEPALGVAIGWGIPVDGSILGVAIGWGIPVVGAFSNTGVSCPCVTEGRG